MRVTRRSMMAGGVAGALAVPTLAGQPGWRWAHGEASVLLFDPLLGVGRRFAEAGTAAGGSPVALVGDPVRLAQRELNRRPALVAGVSRHADALLIRDVAREHGYREVAAMEGDASQCLSSECDTGWGALAALARSAGARWIEALAAYAARPSSPEAFAGLPNSPGSADPHCAFAWVLARDA